MEGGLPGGEMPIRLRRGGQGFDEIEIGLRGLDPIASQPLADLGGDPRRQIEQLGTGAGFFLYRTDGVPGRVSGRLSSRGG